jgi:hypothetical protein
MKAFVLLALALPGAAPFQEEPAAPEFFEAKVRPLLEARCFKCHSAQAGGKVKGGLRLDSREALLKGGDQGPAAVPGSPDQSLLVRAVSYEDPDFQMPPKERLPRGEVEILVRWIKAGAPWPETKDAARPRRKEKEITDADRAFWSFRPVREAAPPALEDPWCRNDIDRFILAKLRAEGLSPAPEADRRTLLRRLTFDLHGLPPAPEELEAFLKDPASDAYERAVDRLLASPRYGERWARPWLDLVRYAESDGYKQDAYRPHAWPYRDYVIRSLNDDKPYDRFVQEQLAGDEIAPDDPAVGVATGFLRLGIYEYNQRNAYGQWRDILNDITDVAGDVFLGLGLGCARCHDHKFDPILQRDYFALQAFFAPLLWRDDLPRAGSEERAAADARRKEWEEKTAPIRAELAAVEKKYVEQAEQSILSKFLPELQDVWRKPAAARSPYENQIADLVDRQVVFERTTIDGKIKGADREKWSALKRKLAEFDALKGRELPPALVVSDVGAAPPPTTIPGDPEGRVIEPAFLSVLRPERPRIDPLPGSTGRRTALARWLTDPANPLAARVPVNRLWQGHFGRGLVGTASDFGRLGETPSHPELLDWLAARFVREGWSLKQMHRLMVTSAAYRQSGRNPAAEAARLKDPENRWLWRANSRRLEAEQIRDAMLAASGELDRSMGGPAVDWTAPRRTIYTKALRNLKDPLLEAFDLPDPFQSVPGRNATTTATQALLLMNGRWPLERAEAFARRIRTSPDPVGDAYRLAYGRAPAPAELEAARAFLGRGSASPVASASDIPLAQTMPDRGGQAARIRGTHADDRFRASGHPVLPKGDFTIEAIVILDSLYEDASVRVIASQWEGRQDRPGWSFGITSRQSKHQPRNLILQIVGDAGYEVIASDLRLELHKTHYVAASVKIGETGEAGVTFTMLDLSDPEAQLKVANVRHRNTGGTASKAAFVIGGRDGPPGHGWDGLIDEVRLSSEALPREQLLIHEGGVPPSAVSGHWRFEADPGFLKDSGPARVTLVHAAPPPASAPAPSQAGLIDFCHAVLNSNEFLYVD